VAIILHKDFRVEINNASRSYPTGGGGGAGAIGGNCFKQYSRMEMVV